LLYSINRLGKSAGKPSGAVTAFAIDPSSGKLTLLNQQSSGGEGPCHLVVDPTGRCVVVANYSSGSAACLPIEPDGRLGKLSCLVEHSGSSVNPKRQQGPHAHGVTLDAANRFAFVADLGLDKIMVYRFDAAGGKLTANDPAYVSAPAGAGPRHFVFHPIGRYAYAVNELDSTMTAFSYDARRGVLRVLETLSTLPAGFRGDNTCAEIQAHPSGKFVYGSNRGHDSIAIFAIDARTGKLRPVGHELTRGKTPRNFAIDPSGRYLLAANEQSGDIVVFRIDAGTGKLCVTGSTQKVPAPMCITMLRVAR
jgi:6-phosphogluconolactonase